jgi:hypothetical protein
MSVTGRYCPRYAKRRYPGRMAISSPTFASCFKTRIKLAASADGKSKLAWGSIVGCEYRKLTWSRRTFGTIHTKSLPWPRYCQYPNSRGILVVPNRVARCNRVRANQSRTGQSDDLPSRRSNGRCTPLPSLSVPLLVPSEGHGDTRVQTLRIMFEQSLT